MSRVAKMPIQIPKGVQVVKENNSLRIKGPHSEVDFTIDSKVNIEIVDGSLHVKYDEQVPNAKAMAGTVRAIVSNHVSGAAKPFECKLVLVGVGYKAQTQGKSVLLNLGYSHPIVFNIPAHITIDTPIPTEIIVKGHDKALVKQTAAIIRDFRPPENYKGKGIRYANEVIILKETKKK